MLIATYEALQSGYTRESTRTITFRQQSPKAEGPWNSRSTIRSWSLLTSPAGHHRIGSLMAGAPIRFRLRFDPIHIRRWAARYSYPSDQQVEGEIGPRVRRQGFFTRPDFLELCRWKSPRTARLCAENPDDFSEATTRTALSVSNERLKIEVLTLLRGVNWPTASVMLHFGARDPYPILDYRALWSLGVERPPLHAFGLWWAYTLYCRDLAEQCGVSMRTLDRALWQFAKENQPKSA